MRFAVGDRVWLSTAGRAAFHGRKWIGRRGIVTQLKRHRDDQVVIRWDGAASAEAWFVGYLEKITR